MFYRRKVIEAYRECVALNPKADAEMKAALNTNERVPGFIDRLAVQLEDVAAIRFKRGKPNLPDKVIKDIVYDMTDMFVAGLKETAKRNYESDLDRIQREQAAQKAKEIAETAEGNISEEFKEMGLVAITDEREATHGE